MANKSGGLTPPVAKTNGRRGLRPSRKNEENKQKRKKFSVMIRADKRAALGSGIELLSSLKKRA